MRQWINRLGMVAALVVLGGCATHRDFSNLEAHSARAHEAVLDSTEAVARAEASEEVRKNRIEYAQRLNESVFGIDMLRFEAARERWNDTDARLLGEMFVFAYRAIEQRARLLGRLGTIGGGPEDEQLARGLDEQLSDQLAALNEKIGG
jgi:hypothetical protein